MDNFAEAIKQFAGALFIILMGAIVLDCSSSDDEAQAPTHQTST